MALVFATLVAMSCGGGDDSATNTPVSTATPTPTPVDVASIPELADGVLTMGAEIDFPPEAYYLEGTRTPAGFEVDLMKAMAEKLGVDVAFEPVADAEAAVTEEAAGMHDAVIASITMTSEHQAVVDLVPYLGPVGIGILVRTGNPQNILRIRDICGHSVAVRDIPNHHFYLEDIGGDFCHDAPIDERAFPDYASGAEQVRLGTVDLQLAEDPVVAYEAAHSNGELEQGIVGFDSQKFGIGVRKESPQLTAALTQAFHAIRDDGTYAQIIADWSLEDFPYLR